MSWDDFIRGEAEAANGSSTADTLSPLQITDPTRFQGQPIPQRQWIIPLWIPRGVVTGLYGPGGTGKTLLVQQLISATALNRPWLGLTAAPIKSLAVFCEDDDDELQRRQADINRLNDCDFRDLKNMRWMSRLGDDNILMHFNGGRSELTPFFNQLVSAARDFAAELVIIDTVADTFGGNQNDAGQVRQFVQMALGRIAREIKGSVVACAHPSRDGQRSGSGESGSVQWDAAFRSRLYLSAPANDDPDAVGPEPNARILTRKKANYAPRDETIDLQWRDGAFIEEHQSTGTLGSIERRTAERVFLDLLDTTEKQGRYLSASKHAGNYAPKIFGASPNRGHYTKRDFASAMERLFAADEMRMELYGRTADERRRIVRVVEEAGDEP